MKSDRRLVERQLSEAAHQSIDSLFKTALRALEHDLAEQVLAAVAPLLKGQGAEDPRLWQVAGLAFRHLQDTGAAHEAFTRAYRLAPSDGLLAHSRARTALEAGFQSSGLYTQALLHSPSNHEVLLGQSAALLAEGRGNEALHILGRAVAANPTWADGHQAWARLASTMGLEGERLALLRATLARNPGLTSLWGLAIRIALQADDHETGLELVGHARQALGSHPELDRLEATCRSEIGDAVRAQTIFDRLPSTKTASSVVAAVRNLIRLHRFDEALQLASTPSVKAHTELWPYRALLWRLLGDPKWEWLEGDPRLIRTWDISSEISMPALADNLRLLHVGVGSPLDQSVRGGSQTDGNLLVRTDPQIRTLRAALIECTRQYISQLPPMDKRHPTLAGERDQWQFAGSWSVRLTAKGFHIDHVHQHGWLSAVCYVALPEQDGVIDVNEDGKLAGWLTFGECRRLLPEIQPFHRVRPEVGKLVLFPSTTWHGTRQFAAGERMTIAFDIGRRSRMK
ncbi:putative 2OG-Fe(II) oxygenase [Novosphingobium olei]|uniref:putative 2OG-Fe(II) oxygenase n=1 Tax=Novosphingobium olei TaxID=2728851 RepID=UPI00308BDABC|nr:putative 2OG-Fe(II) oxygenase [Novosphingobium olei]